MKSVMVPSWPLQDLRGSSSPSVRVTLLVATLALGLLSFPAGLRSADSDRSQVPQFKYFGGTENVPADCVGSLQLIANSLRYTCGQYSLEIPYSAIQIMEYRADVSRHVRKLKLKWRVIPAYVHGHDNRFFTLVYRTSGTTRVAVFDVPQDEMNPYLAEIDLKSGRRVDVQRHECYE
jgi:hypothetical protein